MVKKRLISIIIRGRNEARWLKILFKELKKQTIQNYEIIFCDNNSDDETDLLLKKYNIKKIIKFSKYIPGEILNKAIKKASGKYIGILSSHCIPANKYWIFDHIKNLSLDNSIAATYGKQIALPGTSVQNLIDMDIIFKDQPIIYNNDPYLNNANAFYKSKILKKNLFSYKLTNIEDRIWANNIIKKGYKISYSAKAGVFHLHGIHQHESKSIRAENTYKILVKKYQQFWKNCEFLKQKYHNFSIVINSRRINDKKIITKKINQIIFKIKKSNINLIDTYLINNFNNSKSKKNIKLIKIKKKLKEDLKSIYSKYKKNLLDVNYIIFINLNENFNLKKIIYLIKKNVYYQNDSITYGEIIQENFLIEQNGNKKYQSTNLENIKDKPLITLLKWSKGSIFQIDNLRKGTLYNSNTKIIPL